jgi:adenine-specific DNA-methyltransferase
MPKYDHLSKEELVRLLQARDRRDATRFGLVWEANEIDRDKALNSDFVALDLDPELSAGNAPWRNLIIEGDNFDALRYLRMTCAGRVKCILIDPPYNTGEKDFVYNDRYVDSTDSWKHSTWIEFLYQRLVIARDLLTEDGVLMVCINDKNRSKLEMLMEKVMPNRCVGSFVWRTRSGANDSKEYFRSMDHEYLLCFANSEFTFAGKAKTSDSYSNPDNDPRGVWCNDNLVKSHNYKQRPNTFYPIQNPDTGVWYACDPDNVWRFASESRLKKGQQLRSKTIEQIITEKKILWPKDERSVCYETKAELVAAVEAGTAPRNLRLGNTDEEKEFWDKELDFWVGKTIGYGKPRYKRHLSEVKRSEKPFSSWVMPSALKKKEREELDLDGLEVAVSGGTLEGTSLVQEILGNKDFDYPKPLSLIQSFVKQTTNGDDIVLDFFAGSGTTAHAVLAQNEVDEQSRRFIMVSNSEASDENPQKNVCRDVCARRVQRVIDGYSIPTRKGTKDIEGVEGDFAYLRCRRIAPGRLLDIEHEQVWTALQMIHGDTLAAYKAGDFLIVKEGDSALAYVPRFKKSLVPKLRKALEGCVSAIVYSWQPELLRQQVRSSNVQHEAIPESLARRFGLKG